MKARPGAKFLSWKLVLIHMQTKLIFIMKSFALSLAFTMKFTATRQWPITGLHLTITTAVVKLFNINE